MKKPKKYALKCRDCGKIYSDDDTVKNGVNPSGIPDKICPTCDGVLDHELVNA